MKKVLNLISVLALILTLCLSVLPFGAAAESATISFSNSNPSVGSTVTVTIKVSATEMYAVDLSGTYNEDVLSYQSGASQGGAGNFQIVEALSGEAGKTYTLTFKALKAGSSAITVGGLIGDGNPPVDLSVSASANMTVKDVTLSSNANLKSLTVSAGSLSPRFSASTTNYTVNVKKSVTNFKVYATTADTGAKFSVSGDARLSIGANKFVVTVTAASGATKAYTITVNRSNVEEEVVSDVSSAPVPPSLEIVVLGAPHVVCQDISDVALPTGFNVAKRVFGGEEVAVATDSVGEIVLYFLKQYGTEEPVPFTYNETANSFTRVRYIEQGEKKYIAWKLPDGLTASKDYYATTLDIGGGLIDCYASNDKALKDFYYIYCYFDGKYNTYRYDSVEKILQRSPEFELIKTVSDDTLADLENKSFIERFKTLSGNAKTIVVVGAVLIIGVIALVVLFIIKFIRRRKIEDFDLPEEDFEDIDFDDNFEIISDDE